MGAETSTLLSLLSFVVAAAVAATQLMKWVQEFKDRRRLDRDASTKAGAERDSIAVKSAEGALLMMQGLLETARATEAELRAEIKHLETSNRIKDDVIRKLGDDIAFLRRDGNGL